MDLEKRKDCNTKIERIAICFSVYDLSKIILKIAYSTEIISNHNGAAHVTWVAECFVYIQNSFRKLFSYWYINVAGEAFCRE